MPEVHLNKLWKKSNSKPTKFIDDIVRTWYILKDYTFRECQLYVNTNGSALHNREDQVVTDTYATDVPTRNVLHLVSLWYCGCGTFVGVTSGSAFVLIVIWPETVPTITKVRPLL